MNEWLQKTAKQHQDKDLARTYIAATPEKPQEIIGFFSLLATAISTEGMAGTKLPLEVSAGLLGRLAVDHRFFGKGIGEHLLLAAFDIVLKISEAIGLQCIVVDAIDARAVTFYEKYGFESLTDRPNRLFLPMATLKQA